MYILTFELSGVPKQNKIILYTTTYKTKQVILIIVYFNIHMCLYKKKHNRIPCILIKINIVHMSFSKK